MDTTGWVAVGKVKGRRGRMLSAIISDTLEVLDRLTYGVQYMNLPDGTYYSCTYVGSGPKELIQLERDSMMLEIFVDSKRPHDTKIFFFFIDDIELSGDEVLALWLKGIIQEANATLTVEDKSVRTDIAF